MSHNPHKCIFCDLEKNDIVHPLGGYLIEGETAMGPYEAGASEVLAPSLRQRRLGE